MNIMSQYILLHIQALLDFPERNAEGLKDFYLEQRQMRVQTNHRRDSKHSSEGTFPYGGRTREMG